jgi:alkylation response protein AidB-like acyl-CoA dehydrogenase
MVASGWSLERELPTELTVTEAEFLERSRTWLAAEREMSYLDGLAARSPGEFFGIEPRFSRRLGEAGLLAVTTPAAVGGAGRSHLEQALLAAELAWQRLPVLGHFVAEREVIPALLRHGTAGSAGALAAGAAGGRGALRAGLHRARHRLRPRLDLDPGRARRERLGAERREVAE